MVTTELETEKKTTKRRKTAHLKLVPPSKAQREEIRLRCRHVAARLDKSRPLPKDEMESVTRQILGEMNLPEGFLGWTMVVLSSDFIPTSFSVIKV